MPELRALGWIYCGDSMRLSKSKSARRFRAKHISTLLFALTLLTGKSPPSFATSEKLSWEGKYRQESGAQDLYLERYGDLLSVDIVSVGQSQNSLAEGSHFVARIKGRGATFDDHEGCKTQLIRNDDGVEIKDYCGAAQRDNGQYKKVP